MAVQRAAARRPAPARRRTCRTGPAPPRPSALPGARSGRARRPRRSPPISCRIFASSSALSSTKSRTACRAQASRMAPRDLTGCMKWIAASGNIWRTSATSPIEAQSKCATPPACDGAQHRRFRIALHRVQHVARKRRDEFARGRLDGRRTHAMHRLLGPFGGDEFVNRGQRHRRGRKAAAQRATRPSGRGNGSLRESSQAPGARERRDQRQGKDEERSPALKRRGDRLSRCCEYFASRQTDQQT